MEINPLETVKVGRRRTAPPGAPYSARLAQRCRAAYILARTAFESRTLGPDYVYEVPKRWDGKKATETDTGVILEDEVPAIWPQLARFCLRKKIDPETYIRVQFEQTEFNRRAPEPNQLLSPRRLRIWEKLKHHLGEQVRIELASNKAITRRQVRLLTISEHMSTQRAFALVLSDNDLALSPLFRYCLALSIGGPYFDRLAGLYEVMACFQYQRYRRYYQKYWEEVLPPDFSEKAAAVYATATGNTHSACEEA